MTTKMSQTQKTLSLKPTSLVIPPLKQNTNIISQLIDIYNSNIVGQNIKDKVREFSVGDQCGLLGRYGEEGEEGGEGVGVLILLNAELAIKE